MIHDCDLCGSSDAIEVPHAREYTGGQPIHICCGCGFVYVRARRTAQEIAASWSGLYDGAYQSRSPAVIARLTYVAETIRQQIGIEGKSLCDIGAGDGTFLDIAHSMGAWPSFGIEPSAANRRLLERGIPHFPGAIEDVSSTIGPFDIVTINWTLENCSSCIAMLRAARRILKPDGHLVVATGSRILVPFKKPLSSYLNHDIAADMHCFRWSFSSLTRAFMKAGLQSAGANDALQCDWMVMSAQDKPMPEDVREEHFYDPPSAVLQHFADWARMWP